MRFKYFILLLFVTLFVGCGGDSSIKNSYSNNEIEIKKTSAILDPSQKRFYLGFSITNHYPENVAFELSNISVDLNACKIRSSRANQDIISFSEPNELHEFGITVDFFTPCVPTAYRVKAINNLTYKTSRNRENYISDYQPITIDGNLTIDTTSIFDYNIQLEAVNGSSKIGLETTKRYKLSLNNLDTNSSVLNINADFMNENVNSVTVKSSDILK